MYLRCLYVSRATREFSAADLYDIVRVSQNRNTTHGLTGALLFADGFFAQCLEGESFSVEQRIDAIRRDPRHTDFDVRASDQVPSLLFPDHWMALGGILTLADDRSAELGYLPGFQGTLAAPENLLALLRSLAP